jgi:hypothetical protein
MYTMKNIAGITTYKHGGKQLNTGLNTIISAPIKGLSDWAFAATMYNVANSTVISFFIVL